MIDLISTLGLISGSPIQRIIEKTLSLDQDLKRRRGHNYFGMGYTSKSLKIAMSSCRNSMRDLKIHEANHVPSMHHGPKYSFGPVGENGP